MLFRTQVIILAVLVCAVSLLGQDQTAVSSAQTYREMLRANSEDPQANKAGDSDAAREAYKEHLRQMSGDDSVETQHAASPAAKPQNEKPAPPPSMANAPSAAATSAKAEAASAEAPSATKSLSDVSLKTAASNQPPAASGSIETQHAAPQAADSAGCHSVPCSLFPVPSASAPCDSYCRQLRQTADGQTPAATESLAAAPANITTERNFVKNLAFDQLHIWESPFKLRDSDATWAVPFGIVTGSLIATDRDVSKEAATPSRIDTSKKISDYGLYSFIGAGAGFYGLRLMTHDDHKRETGLLSGEAFINATLVAETLKLAFGRQRPFEGDGFGHIGKGGSSFPSEHAIGSFAIATVIAHEYPNPFVQIGAYGLAATVAATRVTAGQHFPSDVLVGSAFGYLIGRKIYNDHHNPELGGAEYGTFVREHKYDAEHSGSAYVPLESWVYPVIDRLAALGIVHSNFDSERPFTRLECARLAAEAAENTNHDDVPADTRATVDSLQQEFSRESEVWGGTSDNRSAELESVYTRATEVAGPVLRDGYHFGQTLYNDYGRPYGRGFNEITGFSARATSGPVVFYFRGEYQHAPGNPDYSPQLKSLITSVDHGMPQLDGLFPAEDRFQVLDAYLGVNFSGNQLTLGQQSLWWGPGTGGDFMLTNNAEPLNMIRLSSVSPVEIPLLSRFLGPLRYDMFVGQTDGYHYLLTPLGLLGPHLGTQPFVQGQRFTFKPTPNFEFGLTKTGVFGGSGYPLTADYFFRTTVTTANTDPGATRKPGDRRSGVDVTYRIPKLRNWLTWYAEEFSEDEVSPLFFPRTSAMRTGIYAAKLPRLPRVDLRVEGVYTDIPNYGRGPSFIGYFYSNATYLDGFTKDGNLLGSWIGREGRGVYATSKVWLSARNTIQLGYREAVADKEFIEGGRYQDESIQANFALKSHLDVSAMFQYENWKFPALSALGKNNFASSLQLTYTPSVRIGSR